MTNHISVVGTVATDPKRITTQTGVTLCSFRLASGERRYDREQGSWVDGETNWFSVSAFRLLGEHAAESFRKGERVIVSGKLRVRRWEKDDRSGTAVEIEADAIGHDVRWGVSSFEKRTTPNESPEPEAAAEVLNEDAESSQRLSDYAEAPLGSDGFIPVAAS